jgi:O-antigen/teichoic acid export membrane protein
VSETPDTVPFETARRIARNTAILLSSKFISKPLYLIYIFLVASSLGVEGFGKYSFCLTFAGFFIIIADFGIKTPVQRAIARDRENTSLYFFNALLIKIALALVTIAAFHVVVVLSGYSESYGSILYVALAILILDSGIQMFYNVFRAHEVMHYEALIGVLRLVIMLLATLVVIRLGYGLMAILFVMLLSMVLSIVLNGGFYRFRFSTGRGGFSWPVARGFLKMTVVFGLGSGLYTLYGKIDILMLERMVGQHCVGLYAASYTLFENLEIISIVYASALMPFIFRVLSESRERALRACEKSIGYLLLLGIPMAVGLAIMSKDVISLLYGADFISSAPALTILVWVIPLKYAFTVLAVLLIALDREITGVYTGVLGTCVNILLNLWLIPKYAHHGAAGATFVTEALILVFQLLLVKRYAQVIPVPVGILKLLFANLILALVVWTFSDFGLLIVVPSGALVYTLTLYFTKYFTGEERDFLRELKSSLRNRMNDL